ncbi:hypothetical protein [Paraherbaspirillum soli]|uniref:Uncharacterized protein n=1 Tax=Paraherbaspirillum soli TaxID=631222 RepID=A0ABW0M9M0_9BURK
MLLLSNRPAQLVIEADQVSAQLVARGNLSADVVVPVAKEHDAIGRYEHIAQAVGDAIMQLSSQAPHALRTLNLIVGDSFVFYDVLEIDARRLSAPELNRMASLGMADTLGLDASELLIRCSVQKGGMSAVICGIPVVLVDAIKRAVGDAGCRLNRLEPAFVEFLNRHRLQLKQRHALIARLQNHSLMLGLLQDGNWKAFSAERLSKIVWTELRDNCEAFCSRICVPDQQLLPILFDADTVEIPVEASERWHPLPLTSEFS